MALTVLASALEVPVLLVAVLGLLVAAIVLAVAAKAALPGARSGVHRQTIWLTRVRPDAAAEIDRWMATWAPLPPAGSVPPPAQTQPWSRPVAAPAAISQVGLGRQRSRIPRVAAARVTVRGSTRAVRAS